MRTIKIVLQKIFLFFALCIELPLCVTAFFLDAIIGSVFVLVRFIINDKKGMNRSTELMFEAAGFFIMLVIVTFAVLIGNDLEKIC